MPTARKRAALACLLIASVSLAGGRWLGRSQPLHAETTATTSTDADALRPFLAQYCFSCHSQATRKGGLVLDQLDLANVAVDAEVWEKVARKVHSHAMPPAGAKRPERAVAHSFLAALETSIDKAAIAEPNPGRHPALHRLNRAEYANAVRDLLDLDVDVAPLVPHDDSGFGFDNIADVLSISPMLTERYLNAARKINRLAVGDAEMKPVTEIYKVDKYLRQDLRVSDELPFGSRGGIAVKHYFPVDGEYVVQVFLLRTYDGQIRGLLEPHDLEVRLNGERIEQVTLGEAPEAGALRGRGRRKTDAEGLEVRVKAKAGPGTISVSFVAHGSAPEGMLRKPYPMTSYEYAGDQTVMPGLSRVELHGPYNVTGRGDTPSRQRIFTARPDAKADTAAEEAAARQILAALARRAYRRPVTDADLAPLLDFYRAGRKDADFDAGIERALQLVLVNPEFLFRVEHDPADAKPGGPYKVSDLELATRLSFFLWSSIPDDEMLSLAEQNKLSDSATLRRQVERMLADSRALRMVNNFGGQWLYLRNVPLISPDPHLFPDFDANLRWAMERELRLFLESQVQNNRPVPELLSADYTFVNERLAKHYGIGGIYGDQFRRITLSDDARFGLLGKASILTVTSYNHRTSPVLRGKWLLENLVGSPPPPPPADVPPLKEHEDAETKLTSVRERLEAHRAKPACASCHKIMDPLGFALENFDAIGRWRTNDGGAPIDPAGVLIDGRQVDGPQALRKALCDDQENFVTTVTEKLLTYAMGRGVEYYDQPAVCAIVRQSAADDYRWKSLILAIVESTPFQMRRASQP